MEIYKPPMSLRESRKTLVELWCVGLRQLPHQFYSDGDGYIVHRRTKQRLTHNYDFFRKCIIETPAEGQAYYGSGDRVVLTWFQSIRVWRAVAEWRDHLSLKSTKNMALNMVMKMRASREPKDRE
jgi:hypothetical protein